RAAMAATTAIPIVFVVGGDPVRRGLVGSLNRPGGNVTGVVFTSTDLTAKQLGVLHELVPKSASIAALFDPAAPEAELQMTETEEASRTFGRQVLIVKAAGTRDFADSKRSEARRHAGRAGDQDRSRHEPRNCQGAWHRRAG